MDPRTGPGARGQRRGPRMRARHLVLFLFLGTLFGLAGCPGQNTSLEPPKAFMVPEWNDLHIQSLAYLGVGNSAGEDTDRQTVEGIVEQQLTSGQDRFIVLPLAESRSRATANKAGDECAAIIQTWRDDRKADLFQVKEFCRKVGVDGIIFGDLTTWNQVKVDWNAEGSSYTEVGLRLAIFSGKTGLLAWDAQKQLRKESRPYRPSLAGTGVYQDPAGANRAEHPGNLTPDPPRAEDVTTDCMQSIMMAFPPRPTSG